MKLTIGIPTYNARQHLEKCLNSIQNNITNISYEVIVVDDGNDDTGKMVKNKFPKVKYLKNKKRLGPSGGINRAIEISKGDFFLRLDSDTKLLPQTVSKLMGFIDENPKIGAVGAGLISEEGTHQHSTHEGKFNPGYWFSEYNFLVSKFLKKVFAKKISKPIKVYGMGNATVLVRREVLDQDIILDPKFPFFMEDSDWFVRMQKAGWEVWYCPEAKVIHFGGVSSGDYYIHMTDLALSSLYRFYGKHDKDKSKLTLAILLGAVVNLLVSLVLYIPSRFNKWTRGVLDTSLRSTFNVLTWYIRR